MPRGIYVRKNSQAPVSVVYETDEEIEKKLAERFQVLDELADGAVKGDVRSLIVSGPAGVGKSFTIEQILQKYDPEGDKHIVIKGYTRATGLYKAFYNYRHNKNVVIFDDADSAFFDDTSLNLIKAATDSSSSRHLSWMSEATFSDDDGNDIPRQFKFEGTVIFLTNFSFDNMIEKGHRLAPHFSAMISRSHYIDLAMHNKRDYHIRIKQVVASGMLKKLGYDKRIEADTMQFVSDNLEKLREISLRTVLKVAALRKTNPARFNALATVTLLKNKA